MLAHDVNPDELAVFQVSSAFAMKRRLDLVEAGAGSGDLDVRGQESAKNIGDLRLLRCEGLICIEVSGREPEIEGAIAAQTGQTRSPDRPIKGIKLQRIDGQS